MSNKILDILRFNNQLVTESMKLNKPIPLDCRFIVSNLNNLDTEIPKQYRYPGLIFFVPDTQLTIGTSENKIVGVYYCFENDVNTAIPLHDLSLKYIVHQISGINDLNTIINRLNNDTYSKPGNIVDLKDIGIQVIFDGTDWKYFNGKYTLKSVEQWNDIPDDIKQPNTIVEIKPNIRKVVTSSLELSDEIIDAGTDVDNLTENNRYYLLNGYLYYRLNGTNYQLTTKFYILNGYTINKGINIINHNLNSNFVSVKIYLYIDGKTRNIDTDISQVDMNTINIESSLFCNQSTIIIESITDC